MDIECKPARIGLLISGGNVAVVLQLFQFRFRVRDNLVTERRTHGKGDHGVVFQASVRIEDGQFVLIETHQSLFVVAVKTE